MRKKLHFDWHWCWPYGNGDMGNRTVHTLDSLHEILQIENDDSQRIIAGGGRFKYKDDATTPNTEVAMVDWEIPIVFASRNLPLVHPKTGKTGGTSVYRRFGKSFRFSSIICCEGGILAVNRSGGFVYEKMRDEFSIPDWV